MKLISHTRSKIAALTTLSLVGALLAAGTAPAAANTQAPPDPTHPATYSACIDINKALKPAGFTDVNHDDVNCLKYYQITTGRTETTYDPSASVLRWQMALFLHRAANLAGVQLLADPADDFTDLDTVSDDTRAAINHMAALEIMTPLRDTQFGPDDEVDRKDMAVMLDNFLKKATLGTGAFKNLDKYEDFDKGVDYNTAVFGDLNYVTTAQHKSILRIYHAGITKGTSTSPSTYSPGRLVTRKQMASFITRTLAHTIARPEGITIQYASNSQSVTAGSDVPLVVSVRDKDFVPVESYVNLFSWKGNDIPVTDGRCDSDNAKSVTGTPLCEITLNSNDKTDDLIGDVEIFWNPGDLFPDATSATVAGWYITTIPSDGSYEYDEGDDHLSNKITVTITDAPKKLQIKDNMLPNAKSVSFGDQVTFTIQVVDADGNPVPSKDVTVSVIANKTVARATDNTNPELSSSSDTNTYKTDDNGRIQLTYRETDPRSGSSHGGDKAWLGLTITTTSSLTVDDKTTLKKATNSGTSEADASVVWDDITDQTPANIVLQLVHSFREVSESGRGATTTVKATVTDQHDKPVSRQRIEFTSDDPNGIGAKPDPDTPGSPAALVFNIDTSTDKRQFTGDAKFTRSTIRGVATLSFNRKSLNSGIETILAKVKVGTETISNRAYHYWAKELSTGEDTTGRLLTTDTESNQMVILETGSSEVLLIKYDSNDQFTSLGSAATFSTFESDLKDETKNAKRVSVTNYQTDNREVSQITTTADRWSKTLDTKAGTNYAVDHGVFVVGAPKDGTIMCDADSNPETPNVSCTNVGKVYVYEADSNSNYGDPVTLESPNRVAGGKFGADVDIGIGGTYILVGAPGEGTGKVYVFTKESTGWASSAVLSSTATDLADLGMAVAISDNAADGEAQAHYAVAVASAGIGVARWTHTTGSGMDITEDPWDADDARPTVSVLAGVGGAGTLDIANDGTTFVGAPAAAGTDTDGTALATGAKANVGKIYVIDAGSTIAYAVFKATTGTLTASNAEGRMLGASVSVTGDGTAAVVGAPGDNAVYVLTPSGANPWNSNSEVDAVKLSDSSAGKLGSGVAINSDATEVVASGGDIAAGERGEVFTFSSTDAWAEIDVTSGTNLGTGSSPNTMFTYMVAFDGGGADDKLYAVAPIITFEDIYEVSTSS